MSTEYESRRAAAKSILPGHGLRRHGAPYRCACGKLLPGRTRAEARIWHRAHKQYVKAVGLR